MAICPECGIDRDRITPVDAIAAIRSFPRRYRAAFGAIDEHDLDGDELDGDELVGDELVRRRPQPGVWSALEYAAHIRGVFELYDERIRRMLISDEDAELASSRLDEDPWEGHDASDGLGDVLDGLERAARALADRVECVDDAGWRRGGVREGERIDVLWSARQAVHEGAHHLRDIQNVLRAARTRT